MVDLGATKELPASLNELTHRIIGLAIEVHRVLGPGLLERIYEDAMCYEFDLAGIAYARQFQAKVPYKGVLLSEMRFDLVVEGLVMVELKSVEKVPEIYQSQLVSYLRATNLSVGLIINFNVRRLIDGVHRKINTGRTWDDQQSPGSPHLPSLHSSSVLSASSALKS